MSESLFERLFIYDIANNHMGDVEHGLRIIREVAAVAKEFPFKFAIKFQYRQLDSFIHPDYKGSSEFKYVKRFSETRLSKEDFGRMKAELDKLGVISMCTPFDEESVDLIEEQGFDIIKIASCSFTDWPLLERIAKTSKPIVASTAGSSLEDIDNVVSFFEHRSKQLCLMHCVGVYPTPSKQLELNQIDFFKKRYSNLPIGYSTHEAPANLDAIKIAVAKGANAFERHVGVPTEKYKLNAYSSTPEQLRAWLQAAVEAFEICGVSGRRRDFSAKENEDLRGLRRGVFLKRDAKAGEKLKPQDVFFAIPCFEGQLLANDFSKYNQVVLLKDLKAKQPLLPGSFSCSNIRQAVEDIVRAECKLLRSAGIKLKDKLEFEISHHYGIEQFSRWGCAIITCVNREYCKKIILLLPGQENPVHAHKVKEETFHLLYGDLSINLDGAVTNYKAGDIVVVERSVKHSFSSASGAVLEEISTTHFPNDSFYDDQAIIDNKSRKTNMTCWADWMEELLS